MTTEAEHDAPQGVDHTAVPEVQDNPLERVARKMGWSPKENWRGPDNQWMDAEAFLEKTPDLIRKANDKATKAYDMAQKVIAKERAKALADAKASLAEARESGDTEAIIDAREAIKQAEQGASDQRDDMRLVDQFKRDNPWFDDDPGATALAEQASNIVARKGGSVEDQLEAALKAVKRSYPEYFETAKSDVDSGERQSKSAPKAPSMQGGQRTAQNSATKAKTYDNIPSDHRKVFEQSRLFRSGDVSKEAYAASWYEENVQ